MLPEYPVLFYYYCIMYIQYCFYIFTRKCCKCTKKYFLLSSGIFYFGSWVIPEYHCDILFYQVLLCILCTLDCEIEWLSNATTWWYLRGQVYFIPSTMLCNVVDNSIFLLSIDIGYALIITTWPTQIKI